MAIRERLVPIIRIALVKEKKCIQLAEIIGCNAEVNILEAEI